MIKIPFTEPNGQRITRILEHSVPTRKDENSGDAVYTDVDELVDIYNDRINSSYYLRFKTGADLQEIEIKNFLDLKLPEAVRLPRLPNNHSGKLESITMNDRRANGTVWLTPNQFTDLPKLTQIDIVNRAISTVEKEIATLSETEQLEQLLYFAECYKRTKSLVEANHKIKIRNNIADQVSDPELSRLEKHKRRLEKRKVRHAEKVAKKTSAKLKPHTTDMKFCVEVDINWNDPVALERFLTQKRELLMNPNYQLDFSPNEFKYENYKK